MKPATIQIGDSRLVATDPVATEHIAQLFLAAEQILGPAVIGRWLRAQLLKNAPSALRAIEHATWNEVARALDAKRAAA